MNHLRYLEKEKEEVENIIHELKIQKGLQKRSNLPIEIVIGGLLLIMLGGAYAVFGFTILSLYLGARGINHIKIKKIEKEIDGYRYVKIGINKEIKKELEQENSKSRCNPLKTSNF